MKLLHIGDVVGKPGRTMLQRSLKGLRIKYQLDLISVNSENAAAGTGLTPETYKEIVEAGADVLTMGDHIYKRKEIIPILEQNDNIVKPANYPPEAPGKTYALVDLPLGRRAAVISLQGRVFMSPVDCPFHAADKILKLLPPDVKIILVDFHAEATSDKQLMGRYLDGRVTAVLGTHTHVATADEQIFPGGTAFQTDVGMTGPMESVIGRKIDCVREAVYTFKPTKYEIALGNPQIHGAIVEFDHITGKATAIERLVVSESDLPELERLAAQATYR
ncbi:MAG: TIGR00282 family metallophosphoesterase [Thermoguttaceae bacterium]|nr:TIGR00282 family metallophosphoesterase [Thermoguttaceae bacterium]